MTSRVIKDEDQLREFLNLLEINKLPFKDIALKGSLFKIYRAQDGKLLGTGGLEFYEGFALLRSVAVVEAERGKSVGKSIVQDLLQQAKGNAIQAVYLLTETAPVFFESLGFKKVARDSVPESVKASSEFSNVCPASAICMTITP